MWYKNLFKSTREAQISQFFNPDPKGKFKEIGNYLKNQGQTVNSVALGVATGNLANMYKSPQQIEQQKMFSRLKTKNFESVEKFLEYLNQFPDNLTLEKRIENFAKQGYTINGQPLNQNPVLLEKFLEGKIDKQYLQSQIQHKNFVDTGKSSAEQNAMFALADYAKANGISIYQATVDAAKNDYKVNNVPILQHPMFAGAQEKLEAMTNAQNQQQQSLQPGQPGQQVGQPQQGSQNG
jgi:uncharacterized protein YktA (UPF0223 family)